ncbi:hypothetical protein [Kordiimonas aestuarii]|uniref:hypothetical protein n=1 Tax=Kordiimonas aestuarii TaxID=1005925 RepID=UPI0021D1B602|nr:hypothetical protein [Kordiimonas aestuarii]
MNIDEKTSARLGAMTADEFSVEGNSGYELVSGDVSLAVELVACNERPDSAAPDSTRTPFSITFRAEEDTSHLMQQVPEFHGAILGLDDGPVDGLLINRTLRPVNMPPGAYFHVVFG